jgi:hypothetical protein
LTPDSASPPPSHAQLRILDLSGNDIAELKLDELPKHLSVVYLDGNPCVDTPVKRAALQEELAARGVTLMETRHNPAREARGPSSSVEGEAERGVGEDATTRRVRGGAPATGAGGSCGDGAASAAAEGKDDEDDDAVTAELEAARGEAAPCGILLFRGELAVGVSSVGDANPAARPLLTCRSSCKGNKGTR